MPTVRPGIKPLVVFPSPVGKTECKPLRVFPAEVWEKFGGAPGRYRIQVGNAYVVREGESKSFFTEDGLGRVLVLWAKGALGLPEVARVYPSVEKGTPVWARVGFALGEDDEEGRPAGNEIGWAKTRTRTVPFCDEYGDWRVWVYLRPKPVLLADLRPRADGAGLFLREPRKGGGSHEL